MEFYWLVVAMKTKNDTTRGVLRVGSETTFPPFEFTEGEKYVGFDVDLSEAISKKIGLKMEFKSMGFDALIPAVQSGDIDMIAAVSTLHRNAKKYWTSPMFTSTKVVSSQLFVKTTLQSTTWMNWQANCRCSNRHNPVEMAQNPWYNSKTKSIPMLISSWN